MEPDEKKPDPSYGKNSQMLWFCPRPLLFLITVEDMQTMTAGHGEGVDLMGGSGDVLTLIFLSPLLIHYNVDRFGPPVNEDNMLAVWLGYRIDCWLMEESRFAIQSSCRDFLILNWVHDHVTLCCTRKQATEEKWISSILFVVFSTGLTSHLVFCTSAYGLVIFIQTHTGTCMLQLILTLHLHSYILVL